MKNLDTTVTESLAWIHRELGTTAEGKQLIPSVIARDYAAKQGHLPGRVRWR